jgi:hypothetical protein
MAATTIRLLISQSQMVTHPITIHAQRYLTSVIHQELVHSTSYIATSFKVSFNCSFFWLFLFNLKCNYFRSNFFVFHSFTPIFICISFSLFPLLSLSPSFLCQEVYWLDLLVNLFYFTSANQFVYF